MVARDLHGKCVPNRPGFGSELVSDRFGASNESNIRNSRHMRKQCFCMMSNSFFFLKFRSFSIHIFGMSVKRS